MTFHIYCEEGFPKEALTALERAVGDSVRTDIPLAVELLFVDGEEIRRLNRETRDTDRVTDVLSYPALEGIKGQAISGKEHPFEIDEEGNLLLGSIVVCKERAEEQAREYGHSYNRELHYLIVHGIMHCLGYDHITDEERAEMREREESVLKIVNVTRESEE